MALLKVVTFPNDVLTTAAKPVTRFDETLKDLVRDMIETMYAEDGVGLAAPQVGVLKQIIVVSPDSLRGKEQILINPSIVEASEEWEIGLEGCLSLPEFTVEVGRSKMIRFKAYDPEGNKIEDTVFNFSARVIQHEIDHLYGILIMSRIVQTAKREKSSKAACGRL